MSKVCPGDRSSSVTSAAKSVAFGYGSLWERLSSPGSRGSDASNWEVWRTSASGFAARSRWPLMVNPRARRIGRWSPRYRIWTLTGRMPNARGGPSGLAARIVNAGFAEDPARLPRRPRKSRYRVTFGPQTPAPYLARTLPKRGALLRNYYGIGHMSLDNYVALVSGQAPNEQTQLDCVTYFGVPTREPAAGRARASARLRLRLSSNGAEPSEPRSILRGCVGAPTSRIWGTIRRVRAAVAPTRRSARPIHRDGAAVRARPVCRLARPLLYFHSIIDAPARCAGQS